MHLLDSCRRDLSGLSGFGAHEDGAKQSATEPLANGSIHANVKLDCFVFNKI